MDAQGGRPDEILGLGLACLSFDFFFQFAHPLLKISSKVSRLERVFPFLGQQTKIK